MYTNIFKSNVSRRIKKKRYKLLAGFSVLLHVLGAGWVFYAMLYNPNSFHDNMNFSRYIIGLDQHEHKLDYIFKIWLMAIQLRYIITDAYVFYNALVNHNLLKYTIEMHAAEGIICSGLFFYQNNKDSFIFGLICSAWSMMWLTVRYLRPN